MFIPAHRGSSPLVRTLPITMLVTIIVAAMLFSWHVFTPAEPVQDRHVDGKLLRGLIWLSESIRETPALSARAEKSPACNTDGTARLTSRLNKIAEYWNTHLVLREPDCNQVDAVNTAAVWLLRQDSDKIKTILSEPTENLEDLIARRDPFRLPGCLFLHGEPPPTHPLTDYCRNDPGWRGASINDLPPGADALWANLANYRLPLRDQTPNTFHYQVENGLDTPLAQGRHQFLSLNADIQAKTQLTAACYTGDSAACSLCPWCNTLGATDMFEGARARMLGILVVDAHDGGIVAAASSHSRCYAAQHSGGALPADCPALPTPPASRPWRLTNHALEQAVMPASLVKIPLAAGLMEADIPAASRDAMVKDWLVHSNTEAFIDTVFCKDQGFQPSCAKKRLGDIQRMASALGWNSGCDGKNTISCGQQDLLDAGLLADLNYPVLTGRLLLGENNAPVQTDRLNLNINAIQTCYKQGHEKRWRECRGADFINTLAELYGQGSAMASPVGIAQLLLQLSAAESGQAQAPVVHLLEKLDGKAESMRIAPHQPLAMKPETAQAIVGAMAQTHLRGTAYAACLKAAQPGGLLRCQGAKDMPLRLAGKTGTPLFPADTLTLIKWREQCAQPPENLPQSEQQRHDRARCGLSPFKWYAALVGKPGTQDWDKAIIVLAERNWNQRTGLVDSVKDQGSNVAAEVGLAVANALASPSDTAWNSLAEPVRPSPAVVPDTPKPAVQAPVKLQNSPQPVLIPKQKSKPKSLRYHHYS